MEELEPVGDAVALDAAAALVTLEVATEAAPVGALSEVAPPPAAIEVLFPADPEGDAAEAGDPEEATSGEETVVTPPVEATSGAVDVTPVSSDPPPAAVLAAAPTPVLDVSADAEVVLFDLLYKYHATPPPTRTRKIMPTIAAMSIVFPLSFFFLLRVRRPPPKSSELLELEDLGAFLLCLRPRDLLLCFSDDADELEADELESDEPESDELDESRFDRFFPWLRMSQTRSPPDFSSFSSPYPTRLSSSWARAAASSSRRRLPPYLLGAFANVASEELRIEVGETSV